MTQTRKFVALSLASSRAEMFEVHRISCSHIGRLVGNAVVVGTAATTKAAVALCLDGEVRDMGYTEADVKVCGCTKGVTTGRVVTKAPRSERRATAPRSERLTRGEVETLKAALATYAAKVNRFYALKLGTLARKLEAGRQPLQPRTLTRALLAHQATVDQAQALKLAALARKVAQ